MTIKCKCGCETTITKVEIKQDNFAPVRCINCKETLFIALLDYETLNILSKIMNAKEINND